MSCFDRPQAAFYRAPYRRLFLLLFVAGCCFVPETVLAEPVSRPDSEAARREELRDGVSSIQDATLRTMVYAYREHNRGELEQTLDEYASIGHFRSRFPESYWTDQMRTHPTNENGKLAWEMSRRMLSLTCLYEVTGDTGFLRLAWQLSLAAMAARDDHIELENFKGKVLPAWGTARYGSGRRTHYLVHSALILEPILEVLAHLEGLLPGSPDLPESPWAAPDERRRLLEQCLETVHFHESEYRVGPLEGESHFVHSNEEEGRERRAQPFNRQTVYAYDLYLVSLLTGETSYRDQAERVLHFLRNRLHVTDRDAYIWAYEARPFHPDRIPDPQATPPGVCEDISHGFCTVEPIPKLVAGGIVFDGEDLARFGRTVTKNMYVAEYDVFFTTVCPRAAYSKNYAKNLPGWLCLSGGDPEVYRLLANYMLENIADPEPHFLSYLIAFRPE